MSKSLGTGIDPRDLIDGGPRPPVFAKHGRGPGRVPGLRCRRRALGPAGDVLRPGRALQRGEGRPGPAADQQALERLAPDPAARRSEARAARRAAVTARTAGSSSRLQRARYDRSARRSTASSSRGAALALYDFIYAELCDWYLELVKPRLYEGDARTPALPAARADRDGHARAPADPVRDRGDLQATSRAREGLLAARVAAADAGIVDTPAEAELERAIAAIQAIRAWRDAAEVKPSAVLPARLRADGYEATLDQHLRGWAGLSLADANGSAGGGAAIAIPGGVIEILPSDDVDLEAAAAQARRQAQASSSPRSSAPRASSATPASSPRRRRRWSRPSAPSSSRCAQSWRRCETGEL